MTLTDTLVRVPFSVLILSAVGTMYTPHAPSVLADQVYVMVLIVLESPEIPGSA